MQVSRPELPPRVPRRGTRLTKIAGRSGLWLAGWELGGTLPDLERAVVVVAPHTSNWDFVVGVAGMFALGARVSWLGKHTVFRPPWGWLMRWLDGVPVDRTQPGGIVEEAIRSFGEHRQLLLALSPEGTRRRVTRWHTGFWRIAAGARVPVVPVALDWGPRRIVIGEPLAPGLDPGGVIRALGEFYAQVRPRRPERFSLPEVEPSDLPSGSGNGE